MTEVPAFPSKTLTVSLGPGNGPLPASLARAAINDVQPDDIAGIWVSLDANSNDVASVRFHRLRYIDGKPAVTVETHYIRAMSLTLSYLEI